MLMMAVLSTGSVLASTNHTRPNLVLFLQDDQDFALGGWSPMRKTMSLLQDSAALATNWFIHTPVCCPSRGELLSGRYFHNIRHPTPEGGCMHVNTDVVNLNSFGAVLGRAGYTLGYFGKHMNQWYAAPSLLTALGPCAMPDEYALCLRRAAARTTHLRAGTARHVAAWRGRARSRLCTMRRARRR